MDKIEHKKGKIYYSMGEVSEMFDVNPSLIRFWESKFDILKPHKNKKGNRMFTPQDVDSLKLIYHLVKEKGMTLAGAQKRLKENPEGISRDMEVVDRLMGIKAILMEIREELRIDGNEVYRDDDTDMDDHTRTSISNSAPPKTVSEIELASLKVEPEIDPAIASTQARNSNIFSGVEPLHIDELQDIRAEEKWLDSELDDLDRLDRQIEELSQETDISPMEADMLFEEMGELSLSIQEPAPAPVTVPASALTPAPAPTETSCITEDELVILDEKQDSDYPEDFTPLSADNLFAEPTAEIELSLFGSPPATAEDSREETPSRPHVIEQTLF